MVLSLVVLLAFGAMLAWGVGDFFIQRTVRKMGDVETLGLIGAIGSLALLPFVIGDIMDLSGRGLSFLVIVGIFTFLIGMLNMTALRKGKLSIVEVVLTIELPVTLVLGLLLFREYFSFMQLTFIILSFLGIALTAMKTYPPHLLNQFERGIGLALVTAIGYGFIDYFTAYSSRTFSPLLAIWLPWTVFALICIGIIMQRRDITHFFYKVSTYKRLVLITALIDVLAWVLYSISLSLHHLVLVTAITESYPAVAIFLDRAYNKTHVKMHQYIGAAIALVASILLALTL